jgi:hypothetical protein
MGYPVNVQDRGFLASREDLPIAPAIRTPLAGSGALTCVTNRVQPDQRYRAVDYPPAGEGPVLRRHQTLIEVALRELFCLPVFPIGR